MKPDLQEYLHPSPITPSLWWVGRGDWGALPMLTVNPDCNIYLLKGAEFDVLIDCGMGSALRLLQQNVRRAGSDPSRIREIWLTHSHFDHFLGASRWTARYPQTVCRIAQVAIDYFEKKDYRLVSPALVSPSLKVRQPSNLCGLQEGSILQCPPFELRVEALAGHVPDQLGFRGVVDDIDVLFSGDAAIGDQNNIPGMIGWLDGYWLSNLRDYQATLARLVAHPPALLLPGHGRPHYGASARRSLKNCLRRVERLLVSPDLAHAVPFI